jgi:DNA-binding HxlR family transcriptional regulator
MNKYGQYCPMARALEILGDRWTLLIVRVVRDLLSGGLHFNELERGLPGISRTLLSQRLRWLQQAGLLDRHVGAAGRAITYELTPAGRDLQRVADALVEWGAKWSFGDPRPEELDPLLLMWWMRDGTYSERLPQRRIVVEFWFRGAAAHADRYWLLLEQDDRSICLKPPGFETDVIVRADLAAMYQVWLGRITFAEALRDDLIEIDAPPALVRSFPRWFALSPTAVTVRAASGSRGRAPSSAP